MNPMKARWLTNTKSINKIVIVLIDLNKAKKNYSVKRFLLIPLTMKMLILTNNNLYKNLIKLKNKLKVIYYKII